MREDFEVISKTFCVAEQGKGKRDNDDDSENVAVSQFICTVSVEQDRDRLINR